MLDEVNRGLAKQTNAGETTNLNKAHESVISSFTFAALHFADKFSNEQQILELNLFEISIFTKMLKKTKLSSDESTFQGPALKPSSLMSTNCRQAGKRENIWLSTLVAPTLGRGKDLQ